ncbi:hypothetical protein KSF_027990 [Reticulibacter mediterranei]|uniref:Uncharacterized protein n=1 Tax=Reticulibacter mediterranei TaxID=2778369 RepID=A0A8J3INV3_9CHLR|nr:hypothetical protein KSF_027990 [Reticulibacter mediterranei]
MASVSSSSVFLSLKQVAHYSRSRTQAIPFDIYWHSCVGGLVDELPILRFAQSIAACSHRDVLL